MLNSIAMNPFDSLKALLLSACLTFGTSFAQGSSVQDFGEFAQYSQFDDDGDSENDDFDLANFKPIKLPDTPIVVRVDYPEHPQSLELRDLQTTSSTDTKNPKLVKTPQGMPVCVAKIPSIVILKAVNNTFKEYKGQNMPGLKKTMREARNEKNVNESFGWVDTNGNCHMPSESPIELTKGSYLLITGEGKWVKTNQIPATATTKKENSPVLKYVPIESKTNSNNEKFAPIMICSSASGFAGSGMMKYTDKHLMPLCAFSKNGYQSEIHMGAPEILYFVPGIQSNPPVVNSVPDHDTIRIQMKSVDFMIRNFDKVIELAQQQNTAPDDTSSPEELAQKQEALVDHVIKKGPVLLSGDPVTWMNYGEGLALDPITLTPNGSIVCRSVQKSGRYYIGNLYQDIEEGPTKGKLICRTPTENGVEKNTDIQILSKRIKEDMIWAPMRLSNTAQWETGYSKISVGELVSPQHSRPFPAEGICRVRKMKDPALFHIGRAINADTCLLKRSGEQEILKGRQVLANNGVEVLLRPIIRED